MNPEHPIQENLADVKKPAKTKGGLEVAHGPELEEAVNAANVLAEKIKGDKNVTDGDVTNLEAAMGKIKVNFYGQEMTIQEVKEIPDFKQNKEACDMITTGINFNILSLNRSLTFLTTEIARRLVERIKPNQNFPLYLNRLKSMSAKVAQELIKHKGSLSLDGIEEIPLDALRILCQNELENELTLGLKSLSKQQAEAIKNYTGPISLRKLKKMDSDSAHELGEFQGYLMRLGLENLPQDVAQELARFIRNKNKESGYKKLSFISLQNISPEAAQKFDSCVQNLDFPTMEKIDLKTAKGFKNFSGELDFGDFIEFDDETAKALSESNAELGFNIIKEISLQALKYFANRQKKVYLTGLEAENLTPEHLRIIANSEKIIVEKEIRELADIQK